MNDLLTERELRILRLTAEGHTEGEIAAELGYVAGYIGDLRWRINQKLGARRTAHAVHLAYQRGLLTVNAPAEGTGEP